MTDSRKPRIAEEQFFFDKGLPYRVDSAFTLATMARSAGGKTVVVAAVRNSHRAYVGFYDKIEATNVRAEIARVRKYPCDVTTFVAN